MAGILIEEAYIAYSKSEKNPDGILIPLPRRLDVVVKSLPENKKVHTGRHSNSISLDLDPGKYVMTATRQDKKKTLLKLEKIFFHKITEEEFNSLEPLELKHTNAINTTQGVSYTCKLCFGDYDSSSKVSAIKHELEHQGITSAVVTSGGVLHRTTEMLSPLKDPVTKAAITGVINKPLREVSLADLQKRQLELKEAILGRKKDVLQELKGQHARNEEIKKNLNGE